MLIFRNTYEIDVQGILCCKHKNCGCARESSVQEPVSAQVHGFIFTVTGIEQVYDLPCNDR